jgi:hypothetical protein
MLIENTNSSGYALYQAKSNGSAYTWQFGAWTDGSFRIGQSGVGDYMTITSNGYVLINRTTSNNHRLELYGGSSSALRIDVDSGVSAIAISPGGVFGIDKPGVGGGTFKINSTGQLILNNSPIFGATYGFLFKGISGGLDCLALSVANDTNNIINFFNASNTYVASIAINASSVSYGTGSDYRLKEDLKTFNGLEKLLAIKVYDFKYKAEGDRMDGVLAHELQQVIPYAVTGVKDELDDKGNAKIQNVDYSKIVPILIKSIQELKAENDNLKEILTRNNIN